MPNSSIRTAARVALVAAAVGASIPMAAAAQEPLGEPEADRRSCICFDRLSPVRGMQPLTFPRSRIGVTLGGTERIGQRAGVRVQEVTAGGPADRAGVRAGDLILALGGQPLGDEPTDRLRRILAETEPGDTVALELHRDGRAVTVRAVTEAASPVSIAFGGPGLRSAAPLAPGMEGWREGIGQLRPLMEAVRGADRLRLADMNEGLAAYFGTAEGVLVTDVAPDNRFGLRAGDVVLRVDGRDPRDATHLRAILASYNGDERPSIEVMRTRSRTTLR